MQNYELDNMTGQEIKEMIDEKAIALEELDYSSLLKVLDSEIDILVFGSGDMVFINKCNELLEAKENEPIISDERFDEIIEKTFAEHTVIVSDGEQETRRNKHERPTRRIILRRFAIVAAAIITIFATTTLVAAAFGVNIFEYLAIVARQPKGSKIDVDKFTFHHNNETRKYSSIEQMIEEEDLNIMYPTVFPEGITMKDISYNVQTDGNACVQFVTNDIETNVQIVLSENQIIEDDIETTEIEGTIYRIQKGDFVSVSYYLNNNTYYISAKSLDDAFLIIENMKEQ